MTEEDLEPSQKKVFFNRTHLDVGFHYVVCLNLLDEVRARGHMQILHRREAAYNKELLGLPVMLPKKRMMDDGDNAHMFECLAALKGAKRARAGQARAPQALEDADSDDGGCPDHDGWIEDGSEGDPEQDSGLDAVPAVEGTKTNTNGKCAVIKTYR